MARVIGWSVAGILVFAGVLWVRSVTMTVHEHYPRDSSTEVVFHIDTVRAPAHGEIASALFAACHSRVEASVVPGSWEALGDDRYRVELSPALGTFHRRELVGCLEDHTLDHVQATVELVEHHGID